MVNIMANGQQRIIKYGSIMGDLLRELTIPPAHIVAQLNGSIIPRGTLDEVTLQQGDKLELVTMVGGGR
jgi:sulfur carrier protein